MGNLENFGGKITTASFAQESTVDLSDVLPEAWANDIKSHWTNVDDVLDLGGGVTCLPYARVYAAGKETLRGVVKQIQKERRRKSNADDIVDELWSALERAAKEESSYYL